MAGEELRPGDDAVDIYHKGASLIWLIDMMDAAGVQDHRKEDRQLKDMYLGLGLLVGREVQVTELDNPIVNETEEAERPIKKFNQIRGGELFGSLRSSRREHEHLFGLDHIQPLIGAKYKSHVQGTITHVDLRKALMVVRPRLRPPARFWITALEPEGREPLVSAILLD
jgi:hypothetical protein